MEWEHPGLPSTLSASKVLDSVLWDLFAVLLVDFWNVDVQLMPNSAPHWKACNRPSGECPTRFSDGVILLHDAWPNTAQLTCNLLQNFGSEMLDHTVQIWHPSILYISRLEWALIAAFFYNWWRHQACYYHIKFRASWLDELTARCDRYLSLQVDYVKKNSVPWTPLSCIVTFLSQSCASSLWVL